MRPILFIAFLAIEAGAVSGAIVDFNGIANSSTNQVYTSPLTVQGFTFSSGHFHITDTPRSCAFGGCVEFNGTQYLSVEGPELGLPVVMTDPGGAAFDIAGIQASRLFADSAAAAESLNFYNAEFLELTGTLQGGGTVNVSLSLPVSPGYTTFSLPSTFVNLLSLTISGSAPKLTENASWAVDNINVKLSSGLPSGELVAAIPEPATLWLAATGLALSGLFLKPKNRPFAQRPGPIARDVAGHHDPDGPAHSGHLTGKSLLAPGRPSNLGEN